MFFIILIWSHIHLHDVSVFVLVRVFKLSKHQKLSVLDVGANILAQIFEHQTRLQWMGVKRQKNEYLWQMSTFKFTAFFTLPRLIDQRETNGSRQHFRLGIFWCFLWVWNPNNNLMASPIIMPGFISQFAKTFIHQHTYIYIFLFIRHTFPTYPVKSLNLVLEEVKHLAELEVGSYWTGVTVTYHPQTSLKLHKWNAIYIQKFVCQLLLFLSYLC